MVLCLLPTVAFAKDNSTVVLHPSVNHTVTGVKVNVGGTINGHTITSIKGYDITVDLGKYNVSLDNFKLPYAKDIWYGVDNNKVDHISWAGTGSSKKSEGNDALLANGKNTAYYYFKGAQVPPPSAPQEPSDIVGNNAVKVHCTNGESGHKDKTYALIADSFAIGAVTKDASGKYSCTITVQPDKYVAAYNGVYAGHTLDPAGQTGTIKLSWNETGKKWEVASEIPVVFNVKCNTEPAAPQKPSDSDILPIVGDNAVKVHCNANTEHPDKTYGLIENSFTTGNVTENGGKYFCDIAIRPDKYVEKYNFDVTGTHTLVAGEGDKTVTLEYDDAKKEWKVKDAGSVPIVFTVECENQTPEEPQTPKPEPSAIPAIDGLNGDAVVKVKCTNAEATHADIEKSYGLKPGSYTIGDVEVTAEGGYTCTITVQPEQYVADYVNDPGHTLDPVGQTGTITLGWKPDFSGDKRGEWVVASVIPVEFTVKCYTVTYKDGVGGTAFKDQVYTGLKRGDATPGFTGTPYRWNYTFTGWKPAVAPTVSGNAVYTAQWRYNGGGWTPSYPINPVPPVVVVPPKTGDMPFWYSIAQFLGLVK